LADNNWQKINPGVHLIKVMQLLERIQSIRPLWLTRVTQHLARGAGVRENFRDQLERFYGLLEQAVESGDPAWLDTILADWSLSLTQSDLEESQGNLTQVLTPMLVMTHEVTRENLSPDEAMDVLGALLPCFSYCLEKAAEYEMNARVAYISHQLSQAQQTLERLDRSKSDFIAVAAHELKTPLTLVEGYSSMLREVVPDGEDAPETAFLDGISSGTRRLRTIIDDMIDVSLIDNNLLSLNFQPVWINRLLGVLRPELEKHTYVRQQILDLCEFPGSTELTFGDPERLLQVFRNVLMNAVKYTPDGGKIVVDGRKLPGFVEMTVTDTGIGIDTEDQQIIFEKFGRLGNSALHSSGKSKFKGGGPGLGLHIAKGIVEAHGGAIWVESAGYDEVKCPGSIFHVLLPLQAEPPDDKTAKLFAPLFQQRAPK